MPANRLSLHLTDAYREAVEQIHETAIAQARLAWSRLNPDDFDGSYQRWLATVVPATTAGQTEAVRASIGFLTAFLTAELGELTVGASVDGRDYVGRARDGRPLAEALRSPLVGTLGALKRGEPINRALALGQRRATLMVGLAIDHAGRQSLQDAMIAEDRIVGYRRAVKGTCGACLGAAAKTYGTGVRFPVHPGCRCVSSPVLADVPDRFPVPTGDEMFARMTAEEQAAAIGPKAAEAVRSGAITLTALVGTSPQQEGEDFISQAPAAQAQDAA